LRRRYDEITALGAEIVVIGTGDVRYARDFVAAENIPFPVLVDDDAAAAQAASVQRVGFLKLFHPDTYAATRAAWRAGYRLYWPGKRTNQLGATFVIGPGSHVRFAHYDANTVDHAPIDNVLRTLSSPESQIPNPKT